MKVAHIVPYHYRDLVMWKDFHMAIGPILQKNRCWFEFFSKDSSSPTFHYKKKEWYVIVDNGAFEGDALSMTDLSRVCEMIGADELILPDVFGDGRATLSRFYKEVKPSWSSIKVNAMFVFHGPTPAIYEDCMAEVLSSTPITTFGFSYLPISQAYSSVFHTEYCGVVRPGALSILVDKFPELRQRQIHCLGCSTPHELYELNELSFVRSCDTSLAAKATFAGVRFGEEHLTCTFWEDKPQLPRPDNFFFFDGLNRELLKHNIEFLDRICISPVIAVHHSSIPNWKTTR